MATRNLVCIRGVFSSSAPAGFVKRRGPDTAHDQADTVSPPSRGPVPSYFLSVAGLSPRDFTIMFSFLRATCWHARLLHEIGYATAPKRKTTSSSKFTKSPKGGQDPWEEFLISKEPWFCFTLRSGANSSLEIRFPVWNSTLLKTCLKLQSPYRPRSCKCRTTILVLSCTTCMVVETQWAWTTCTASILKGNLLWNPLLVGKARQHT